MANDREIIEPDELAEVLKRYDLGAIEKIREYPRGSRRSPKILIDTTSGRYVLKRRAQGRDKPARVTFAHTVLWRLREKGIPVPDLLRTRDSRESMLIIHGRVYELFKYVPGDHYDASLAHTSQGGKTLARIHRALRNFQTAWQPPAGGYHDSDRVRAGLNSIPSAVSSHDSVLGHESDLLALIQELYESYENATRAVNRLGFRGWESRIIHGDWHPGNLRYRNDRVVAVLDFDAARRCPPVMDLANGMLQFSIVRNAGDPERWPDFFDQARMRRFFAGYADRIRLTRRQRQAVVYLMIESLIAECAAPVAATGSLGQIPGYVVLQMARRKVRWLHTNKLHLERWILA